MKEHEERMAFRLPAAEAEQIRTSASALGVSVSKWLRWAVTDQLELQEILRAQRNRQDELRKAAGLDE